MMDNEWFKGSVDYWKVGETLIVSVAALISLVMQNVEATVNGMLGGYAILHAPDIRDSRTVILKHLPDANRRTHVLDVGAGIGRVSKHLLAPLFAKVSILESDARFYAKACDVLGEQLDRSSSYNCRLQEYRSVASSVQFDLIWIQWVLIYCSDDELLRFLGECKQSLCDPANGLIIIKENILADDNSEPDVDVSDHSIVRSRGHFRRLFAQANLQVVGECRQRGFPSSLYPVHIFVLKNKNR